MDGSGKAVRQIELDPQPAGIISVEWDGKGDGGAEMPDGAYTIQVAASDAAGKEVSVAPLTYGKVASVAYSSTGLQLDLGLAGKEDRQSVVEGTRVCGSVNYVGIR